MNKIKYFPGHIIPLINSIYISYKNVFKKCKYSHFIILLLHKILLKFFKDFNNRLSGPFFNTKRFYKKHTNQKSLIENMKAECFPHFIYVIEMPHNASLKYLPWGFLKSFWFFVKVWSFTFYHAWCFSKQNYWI